MKTGKSVVSLHVELLLPCTGHLVTLKTWKFAHVLICFETFTST